MDVVEMILRRNETLVKDNLRLQRKLGRMAYWHNARRKERDEAREDAMDLKASKDGLARQLGKEQKRVQELEATVAELQGSLNAKLAEEVSHA